MVFCDLRVDKSFYTVKVTLTVIEIRLIRRTLTAKSRIGLTDLEIGQTNLQLILIRKKIIVGLSKYDSDCLVSKLISNIRICLVNPKVMAV